MKLTCQAHVIFCPLVKSKWHCRVYVPTGFEVQREFFLICPFLAHANPCILCWKTFCFSESSRYSNYDIEKIFQKFIWNHKRPSTTTVILRKKNKVGGITLPNIELHYKAMVIKAARYWHKNRLNEADGYYKSSINRPRDQNREPQNKHSSLQPIIFDRGSKHIQWAKDSLFNK